MEVKSSLVGRVVEIIKPEPGLAGLIGIQSVRKTGVTVGLDPLPIVILSDRANRDEALERIRYEGICSDEGAP